MRLTRRNIFPLAGAALLAGVARIEIGGPAPTSLPTSPRVRTLKNGWGEDDLLAAWNACGFEPAGKRVLVLTHLQTDPAIVAGVSRALRREGAASAWGAESRAERMGSGRIGRGIDLSSKLRTSVICRPESRRCQSGGRSEERHGVSAQHRLARGRDVVVGESRPRRCVESFVDASGSDLRVA